VPEQVFQVLFDVPAARRKLKIRYFLFPGLSKLVFLFEVFDELLHFFLFKIVFDFSSGLPVNPG
jgi:hypothetical protein